MVSQESIDAYMKRFQSMTKYKFTEKGDELFIAKLSAESEQINNLHVKAKVNEFEIKCDEPEELRGSNKAPSPMELFLASLANCLEISALAYFSFSGLHIDSVKVKVTSSFDKRFILTDKEAPLPGFNNFNYKWYIKTEEDIHKVEKVLKKVEENCPVKGTLGHSHNFIMKIELI
ncbi:MAG: OsmC family protein [Promethearchaeota archaeon]